jgi:NADH-quinone oxidoreductase subunit E
MARPVAVDCRQNGYSVLTETERAEIEDELSRYPQRRAGCVEALKIVQRHEGWVRDEHIADIAEILDMSRDELDAVATFYPFIFRRPVGKHIILVCDGFSCWTMGYEGLFRALTDALGVSWGGTTADGRFTLLPVSCIGQCEHAPAIMVDDNVHGDLTEERIPSILKGYA